MNLSGGGACVLRLGAVLKSRSLACVQVDAVSCATDVLCFRYRPVVERPIDLAWWCATAGWSWTSSVMTSHRALMPCAKDRPQQRNKLHHRQSGERLPVITIDPDATQVATYGAGKQGSAFARMGQTALSPLVGICGETGDVLVVRAPWWVGQRRPRDGRFIGECVGTIPAGARRGKRLWGRLGRLPARRGRRRGPP